MASAIAKSTPNVTPTPNATPTQCCQRKTMNFHLKDGIYFRLTEESYRDGLQVMRIVKAKDFDDPGELLFEITLDGLCSVVASASPFQEQQGSWDFVRRFLVDGEMRCGGCGAALHHGEVIYGPLSGLGFLSCEICYKHKFEPLYSWLVRAGDL